MSLSDVRDRVTPGDGRLILVGEDNPLSTRPEFALFSRPEGCAGHRLQSKILGLPEGEYLALHRVNLCAEAWDRGEAAESAHLLLSTKHDPVAVVMLGRKVAEAFARCCAGGPLPPFTWRALEIDRVHLVALPHPSGRCRAWNDPGSVTKARALLRWIAPEVAWGSIDHE